MMNAITIKTTMTGTTILIICSLPSVRFAVPGLSGTGKGVVLGCFVEYFGFSVTSVEPCCVLSLCVVTTGGLVVPVTD